MIHVRLALCAESVIRDEPTNLVSAINIYEEFAAVAVPMIVPKFSHLVVLQRQAADAAQHQGRLRMMLADVPILDGGINGDFQNVLVARVITVFQGLILPALGDLRVTFFLADQDMPARGQDQFDLPFALVHGRDLPEVVANREASVGPVDPLGQRPKAHDATDVCPKLLQVHAPKS